MKLVSFEPSAGVVRIGAIVDAQVYDLTPAARTTDMVHLLEQGPDALSRLRAALEEAVHAGRALGPAEASALLAPVPHPRKILCLAGNYQEHLQEVGHARVLKERSTPRVFIKPHTVVQRPGGPIRLPSISEHVDYELELAAVIGRCAKEVTAEEALSYVAGYTIFNDVSARRMTFAQGRQPRDGDWFFDWLNGKWPDTFGPMGPWLVTADEVGDPQSLGMHLWVNDQLRQDGSTAQMIFTVAELVAWCSRLVTLLPGDLIATGTPAGVGVASNRFLQAGDVVRGQIDKLGVLVNPVVARA